MRRRALRVLGYVAAWLVVAVPAWLVLFTHTTSPTVVAGHDAVVRPTLDGRVLLETGPYLPDLRFPTHRRIGVDVVVGKTTASTAAELAQRYAQIAAHPVAEQRRVTERVTDLAEDAALRAAVVGLVPIGLWLLVGAGRRRQLVHADRRLVGACALALVVGGVLVVQPWHGDDDRVQPDVWLSVQDALPEVDVPPELADWQLQGGLVTNGTRRLVQSAFDTYARSKVFYRQVVERVPAVASQLHQPSSEEHVALLVSDRHDNIGMDAVARAIGDAGGARTVIDAGDDTSTGEHWEAFSLDSLDETFEQYDERLAIAGNHDNGTFVDSYLEKRGWTHLDGHAVDALGGTRITGVDDPRSSGLGSWRDQKGLPFDEVGHRVADDVCRDDADGRRIATLVVHDANLGAEALSRGCTDLVLSGHLHVQVGPTRVVGSNGKAGYRYTNGTTGGAAYAIALGSKLKRDAEVTLVTYASGRPVGIQPVKILTTGELQVASYVALEL